MQPTLTTSVDGAIRATFEEVISKTNMHAVGEDLRDVVATDGLGVAILVAWQHGLRIGHIPLTPNENGEPADIQAEKITDEGCQYVYVRVPVRQFRGDKSELVKRGIMNQKADPVWFIYHEDGLVGTFSFQKAPGISLSRNDIREILDALAQQGILIRASINNRQIQFKDFGSKRVIEDSGERVYVRVDKPIAKDAIKLPIDLGAAPLDRRQPPVIARSFDDAQMRGLDLPPCGCHGRRQRRNHGIDVPQRVVALLLPLLMVPPVGLPVAARPQ